MAFREPLVVFNVKAVPDGDHHAADEAPKLLFHKVVAISYLLVKAIDAPDGQYFSAEILKTGGEVSSTEKELLAAFWDSVERGKPRLVTFNGRDFDLPVAKYRALKYEIAAPWFAQVERKGGNYPGREGVDWHSDLAHLLSGSGASKGFNLTEICGLLGLPNGCGVDAAQIKLYVESGRLAEVRSCCEVDVLATYLVFLRVALFRGELTSAGFQASVANLRTYLANERGTRAHLGQFADAWAAIVG